MTEDLPTITTMDIQRYQQLRQCSRRLMSSITKTVPREAMDEIGKALGILEKNTLIFDTLDVSSVFMDSCVFDWIRDGKNVVEKYAEAHPATPGTDEYLVLHAYCRAKYRVLVLRVVSPGAVTYWLDVLSGESIAVMDIGLSQTIASGYQGFLATRTTPLEGHWITTGAPLPIGDRKTGEMLLKTIRQGSLLEDTTSVGEHRLATAIIRACLDSGAAEHVHYAGADEEEVEFDNGRLSTEVKSPGRHIDRNDPCPCGSGKRYRRCCMRKKPAAP